MDLIPTVGRLTVGVVAAITLSACGTTPGVPDPGRPSSGLSVSVAPEDLPDAGASEAERVSRMTDGVTNAAGPNWPAVLGGLHWDAGAQELVVYVVTRPEADALEASIDTAVDAVQGDYDHVFVRVDRSLEELRGLAADVMSDRQHWAGDLAPEIVAIGPDFASNGLVVLAAGDVDEVKDRLLARADGVPVVAEQGARPTAVD